MDQHSTVDHNSASSAIGGGLPSPNHDRTFTASVSAAIAEANAHLAPLPEHEVLRNEPEAGHSLAEMAAKDLDATLQLLAERAQYITEATGAAIALRRGEHSDMLCRASAGTNAPELGALLSMEYGLSGESVRTGKTMSCEDAESDPRVNREGCRQLGIASVVVMPIVSEQQVLGVFELFSGKPHAFGQRDISALQRLSNLVETAVRHAVAAHAVQIEHKISGDEVRDEDHSSARISQVEAATAEPASSQHLAAPPLPQDELVGSDSTQGLRAGSGQATAEIETPVQTAAPENTEPETALPEDPKPEPAKKPLFWTAATQAQPATPDKNSNSQAVPPVLRGLQKCQACGFPVSQGRKFCVECEEKHWRGHAVAAPAKETVIASVASTASEIPNLPQSAAPAQVTPSIIAASPVVEPSPLAETSANSPVPDTSTLFLSSAAPDESWLAANKYILGAMLVVALTIAAIVWLR